MFANEVLQLVWYAYHVVCVPYYRCHVNMLSSRHKSAMTDQGHEPDYRFTFANERTYLAWIRTSLALSAAGIAVAGFLPESKVPLAREALALTLLGLGTLVAATSLGQWKRNRRAIRLGKPLPHPGMIRALALGLLVCAALALVLVLTGTAV